MNGTRRNLIVGVTGGIASGKTTVARELERQGAVRIDADRIGRDVVDRMPQVRQVLREAFGDSVFAEDGSLDRSRLAGLVFSDSEALEELNRIVHPHLLAEIRSRGNAFRREADGGVLVIDAALLVEWGGGVGVDYLVVVQSDSERQIERLRDRDGLSREEAVRRIGSQVDDSRRAKAADEILVNEGNLADLAAKARDLWRRLRDLPSVRATEVEGGE